MNTHRSWIPFRLVSITLYYPNHNVRLSYIYVRHNRSYGFKKGIHRFLQRRITKKKLVPRGYHRTSRTCCFFISLENTHLIPYNLYTIIPYKISGGLKSLKNGVSNFMNRLEIRWLFFLSGREVVERSSCI